MRWKGSDGNEEYISEKYAEFREVNADEASNCKNTSFVILIHIVEFHNRLQRYCFSRNSTICTLTEGYDSPSSWRRNSRFISLGVDSPFVMGDFFVITLFLR